MINKIKLALKKKLNTRDYLFFIKKILKIKFFCIISKFKKADIACITYRHIKLFDFVKNIEKNFNIDIHYYQNKLDHKNYKKIIVINGHQKKMRKFINTIPKEKIIYLEVAFFPQNKNVYFDPKGIHGYSSIRDIELKPLTQDQKKELNDFRKEYISKNFVKDKWDHTNTRPKESPLYEKEFIFVPLQLENDTAYYLTPYKNNQEIIDFIESIFPDDFIIFKAHPHDLNEYKVSESNTLLDRDNKDLQILLQKAAYVVASNSTVLLEALMHKKVCASLGEGFSTNHNVCLECHRDKNNLKDLKDWEPDWEKVDQFLFFLTEKQIDQEFWESEKEIEKLKKELKENNILS
jgi:hypothetical protein